MWHTNTKSGCKLIRCWNLCNLICKGKDLVAGNMINFFNFWLLATFSTKTHLRWKNILSKVDVLYSKIRSNNYQTFLSFPLFCFDENQDSPKPTRKQIHYPACEAACKLLRLDPSSLATNGETYGGNQHGEGVLTSTKKTHLTYLSGQLKIPILCKPCMIYLPGM